MDNPQGSVGSVYLIINQANDKVYVGQTNRPSRRFIEHKHDSRRERPRKMAIHHAMKKHGIDAFTYEILCSAHSQTALDNLERLWIIALRANQKQHGYNVTYGGDGAFRHTAETRRKISHANIMRWAEIPKIPRKSRAKTVNPHRIGIPLSEDHKAKLRKPKNLSPEMRVWKSQKARADMLRIWKERNR